MTTSTKIICIAVILAICSTTARTSAQTFTARYTYPSGTHSSAGMNTPGPYAAASVMGAMGYSAYVPPPGWESTITNTCIAQTKALPGPQSIWPQVCNPTGMANALTMITANLPIPAHFVTYTWDSANQTAALNEMVVSLKDWRSPAVVPVWGQADHWVAADSITATDLGGGSWNVTGVTGWDGGPSGQTDSGGTAYYSAYQQWGGNAWKHSWYQVLAAVNSVCDNAQPSGCAGSPWFDPYFGKFLLTWDPPINFSQSSISASTLHTNFMNSPGIVLSGQGAMNVQLAQVYVWQALSLAGVDSNPRIWNKIAKGVAGTATHVSAVWPSGEPWDYYLIPILSDANTAIAFVQLSGDDGSLDILNVLPAPVSYIPMNIQKAEQLATSMLNKGEILKNGTLTWNPRSSVPIMKSPMQPFYEFAVMDATNPGRRVGSIWVATADGTVARGQ